MPDNLHTFVSLCRDSELSRIWSTFAGRGYERGATSNGQRVAYLANMRTAISVRASTTEWHSTVAE